MNNTRLRGILFDWDGTLVDSYQPMLLSLRYAYHKHLGIIFPRDVEEFRRISPMRLAESTALYAGEQAAAVAESYLWYYANEAYKQGSLFPQIRETLLELRRRGYALGVVTNTSRQRMQSDLHHLRMDDMLESIVTADDTLERKPHPAPLLKGAEKLQLPPQELAYVGDYAGDIIAGRRAGITSVGALWGGIFLPESLLAEQPDHTVSIPQELLALFPAI